MEQLENRIRISLKEAIYNKDQLRKDTLRLILGEIPRLNKKAGESASNSEIVSIIKKLKKSAEETNRYKEVASVDDQFFIIILEEFIPTTMSEDKLREWIKENIDFGSLKNKMQAVGIVKKELQDRAEGAMISKIIKEM